MGEVKLEGEGRLELGLHGTRNFRNIEIIVLKVSENDWKQKELRLTLFPLSFWERNNSNWLCGLEPFWARLVAWMLLNWINFFLLSIQKRWPIFSDSPMTSEMLLNWIHEPGPNRHQTSKTSILCVCLFEKSNQACYVFFFWEIKSCRLWTTRTPAGLCCTKTVFLPQKCHRVIVDPPCITASIEHSISSPVRPIGLTEAGDGAKSRDKGIDSPRLPPLLLPP